MRTDERHDLSESRSDSPADSGLWSRLADRLSAAAARVRDALGTDSPPTSAAADRDSRPDRNGPGNAVTDTDSEPGELTVSRADGRLRVAEGPGAYIESDTWEAVER
jgi:hypothetical protein